VADQSGLQPHWGPCSLHRHCSRGTQAAVSMPAAAPRCPPLVLGPPSKEAELTSNCAHIACAGLLTIKAVIGVPTIVATMPMWSIFSCEQPASIEKQC
jgi:hypothetical protein